MTVLTRKVRRAISKICAEGRNVRVADVHHVINSRGKARARIDSVAVAGLVGIHRSGMDCDGTSYSETFVIPAPVSIVKYMHDEDVRQSWLDGPENMHYCSPVGMKQARNTRDLALEAFEDGHSHCLHFSLPQAA